MPPCLPIGKRRNVIRADGECCEHTMYIDSLNGMSQHESMVYRYRTLMDDPWWSNWREKYTVLLQDWESLLRWNEIWNDWDWVDTHKCYSCWCECCAHIMYINSLNGVSQRDSIVYRTLADDPWWSDWREEQTLRFVLRDRLTWHRRKSYPCTLVRSSTHSETSSFTPRCTGKSKADACVRVSVAPFVDVSCPS